MMGAHLPVMLEESLAIFADKRLTYFFDGTLGAGGFAQALLERHDELELYMGCDQDLEALTLARKRLLKWGSKVAFIHGNFRHVAHYLSCQGVQEVDGMFFDLGVSSMQLKDQERGFSFKKEGPLDMRMDQQSQLTAREIVNRWSRPRLTELFITYGESRMRAKLAAEAIVIARKKRAIKTTQELAQIVSGVLGRKRGRLDPSTLIFQSLRICVNDELGSIKEMVGQALEALSAGGRLGVIAFHSLEDRLIKGAFSLAARKGKEEFGKIYSIMTKKPIRPQESEVNMNTAARSGRLRAIERRGDPGV